MEPGPQPVTVKKLKRVYIYGLSGLPEYVEVIRINKNKRLNVIHSEYKKIEGIIAKRIVKMHKREAATAAAAAAEVKSTTGSTNTTVVSTSTDVVSKHQVREDCRFFVKHG